MSMSHFVALGGGAPPAALAQAIAHDRAPFLAAPVAHRRRGAARGRAHSGLACRADTSSSRGGGNGGAATASLATLLHSAQTKPEAIQWNRATVVENR